MNCFGVSRLVDSPSLPSYAPIHGGGILNGKRWILLVCLAGALLLSALPPSDSAETAFNEMDTPVLVSHPELPRVRVNPAPPVVIAPLQTSGTTVAPFLSGRWTKIQSPSRRQDSRDLQPVLCVFLI